jgi:poly(A) polymerase
MREIWELQLRLPNRRGRRAELLLSHKRFRAAYDFLLLREAAGEELGDLGQWWTEYQLGDPATQSTLLAQLGGPPQSGKTRRRRQKSRRPDQPTPDV